MISSINYINWESIQ